MTNRKSLKKYSYLLNSLIILGYDLIRKIINANRKIRVFLLSSLDAFFISLSFFTSSKLIGSDLNSILNSNDYFILLISIIIAIPFYFITKGYKGLTKYIGSQELYLIVIRNIVLICLIFSIINLSKLIIPPLNFWIIFCLLIIYPIGL